MEQTRKQLKTSSFMVLLFAGISLLQIIAALLFGELNSAQIPAGSPENIFLITKMILLAVSLLLLLPKFYVGLRGLRIAKNPDASGKHIIWAMIVFVFAVLEFIDPLGNIFKEGNIMDNAATISGILLEVLIYYEYIKYARKLREYENAG